jgi:RelA/SpoT family (p)ppGpp synthetase
MGNIRAELEDLALRYVHPEEFQAIEKEIAQSQQERNDTIRIVTDRVQRQLYEMGINARIYGRVKNYYSIFKKMRRQQKGLTDIYDLSAVRVIVNSEKECYEVLGVIHHAFTPIPGRFKDYVAMPKSNFYQSLHTTVIGPNGRPLEVQIRTQDMHRIAEYGIAAHWKYKESGGSVAVANEYEQKLSWLKQMVEMQDDAGDAREYVDSVKLDLFQDEVFVFTPKGRVINLPQGSTPVDFAYRIHTEIGNTCAGGIVNGKLVPLNHILKNGDIVEVLTNKKASPKLDWINFVKTHHAKGRIRQWHKKHFKEQHETQGRQLLEAELTRAGLEAHVKSGRLLEVAKELNFGSIEDLFVAVGYGEINPPRVLNRLRKPEPQPGNLDLESLGAERTLINRKPGVLPSQQVARQAPMGDIQGLKGMLYHLAKCCTPVPGESIVGIVTRSRGVMVHRDDCVNIVQSNPERRMKVQWDGAATPETAPQEKGKFNHSVSLEIHVIDRVGVLKDVLTQIADTHTNLSNAKVKKVNHDHTVYLEVSVDVKDIAHLDRVMAAIRKVNDVLAVRRQHHRPNR